MELYIRDGIVKNRKNIILKEIIDGETYDVFSPSVEQLRTAGWMPYEPPVIEPSAEERYKTRIVDLIRERYSTEDEIAILRQRDSKPEEFAEYNTYTENCKAVAYDEVYGGTE